MGDDLKLPYPMLLPELLGFPKATGHAALWDGWRTIDPDGNHFADATEVHLWTLPD